MKNLLLAALVLFCPFLLSAQCYTPTGSNNSYDLVWSDEFDGTTLDANNWQYLVGNGEAYGLPAGWGNEEVQYYTNDGSNVDVSGGTMEIIVKDDTGANGAPDDYAGYYSQYTSARIVTTNLQDFTYGRFEASIKVPTEQGLWPAFWMLPTDEVYGFWPQSGEIDIMEVSGHEPDITHGTIHYGQPWPGNSYYGGTYTDPSGDFGNAFHEFAVEWEPDEIRWYVDGILIHTVRDNYAGDPFDGNDTGFTGGTTWPFDQDFHIIMNVAVSSGTGAGSFAGPVDNTTTLPASMEVDYVRVYQTASDIYGDEIVSENSTDHTYMVEPVPGATYDWSIPCGANITTSADTNEIEVDWCTEGGDITVEVTAPDCSTTTHIIAVDVRDNDGLNMLDNPSFEGNSTADWTVNYNEGGATVTTPAGGAPDGGGSHACIDVGGTSGNPWAIQLQTDAPLIAGEDYTFTFWAKSDANTLDVNFSDASNGNHSNATFNVSNTWQEYTHTFEARYDVPDGTIVFQLGDEADQQTCFDNFYFSNVEPDDGTSPVTCTLNCPEITPNITTQEICSGSAVDLTTVEGEVNITPGTEINAGDFTYFLDSTYNTPYNDGDALENEGCTVNTITVYGRLQCDKPEAAGTADEYDDFDFTVDVYPNVNNWTADETAGACGIAASVSIKAEDNTECDTIDGTAPVDPGCGNADDDQTISGNYDPGFPVNCGTVTYNAVATCASTSCADCPSITTPIAAQSLCSGTEPDFAAIETEADATGNNIGVYTYFTDTGYATAYAAGDFTVDGCTSQDFTLYGRLQCTDAAASGTAEEFDDFTVTITVYPDVNNWVAIETNGDCNNAPSVVIVAEDATTECHSVTGGTVPTAPTCASGTTTSTIPAGTYDPMFATACGTVDYNEATASCDPTGCYDCPSMNAVAAQENCLGNEPDFPTVEANIDGTAAQLANNGGFTYFMDMNYATAYGAALLVNETCMPITYTIYGRLTCSDTNAAAANADEIDFNFDFTVYPDVTAWTPTSTDGGCGIAATVLIEAVNGDDCWTLTGNVPTDLGCATGNDDQSIPAGTHDPMFAMNCGTIDYNAATAICEPAGCYDCPSMNAVAAQENCVGNEPDFAAVEANIDGTAAELANNGGFTYFMDMAYTNAYDATLLVNETCMPITYTIYGRLTCSDANAAAANADEIDFNFDFTIYPDVTAWTPTSTDGGCGTAATVLIEAVNGDDCWTLTGNVPTDIGCAAGDDDQSISAGTHDPMFAMNCGTIDYDAAAAICEPAGCYSIDIIDPCSCVNDQADNDSATGDGSFTETVTVTSNAVGETWTITAFDISGSAAAGGLDPDSAGAIIVGTTTLTDNNDNTYSISGFDHFDGAGYTMTVTRDDGAMLTIGNRCVYPQISSTLITDLDYCADDAPVALPTPTTDEDGNDGAYTYDIMDSTGATVVAGATNIDPATLMAGTFTITATFDGTDVSDESSDDGITAAFPGCTTDLDFNIEIFDLPDATFVCPAEAINKCAGNVALSPTTAGGVWSGDGGAYVNAANEFEPLMAPLNTPLTITYTVTDVNGCEATEDCIVTVVYNCDADAGSF